LAHRQTAIAAYGTIPGMRSYKKYSVAKLQQSILNFNHHEVIPQYAQRAYFILRQQYFIFPQEIFHFPVRENFIGHWGKSFPNALLRSNLLHLTDFAYSVGVMPNFASNSRRK
jgi:hypothetical protein